MPNISVAEQIERQIETLPEIEVELEQSGVEEEPVVAPRPKGSEIVGKRSITDIIRDLSNPDITGPFIRTRRQGSTNIRYIAWHDATRILDAYAPGWSYCVKEVFHINDKVGMIVTMWIPSLEGEVMREATGNEDDITTSYGDPFSNAESMALRRAAAKFGLGRFLYNG